MIILIDNYDSFSFNLWQLLGTLLLDQAEGGEPEEIRVLRNDALTAEAVKALAPSRIVLSPGPGRPAAAGICVSLVQAVPHIPLLGVCLGHQAVCEAYGATVSYALELLHGKSSSATLDRDCRLFTGLPERIEAGRYHSLAAVDPTLPDCLQVTARTADGEIMAVAHRSLPHYGVQFHPESILTPLGADIVRNFLALPAG
ncbi:MAG: aminodeoxychorismate/anthranilate synthase component II [Propionibacteriaceae bacterium]|jgi:anthranilate synthase component 2|nr:aminodeoxychorismate/anthranilate synthase component II [Propionibacteriaceae bacterium]